jgi:uncharacterized protein (TIGR03086 family)
MRETSLVGLAVPPTVAVVRGVKPDQFDDPTPCGDWTVRHLLDHLLEWGPALAAAGRKASTPVPGEDIEAVYDDLVTAWSEPSAWEGTTRVGGPQELPAAMIGGMVLAEVVVHGWDHRPGHRPGRRLGPRPAGGRPPGDRGDRGDGATDGRLRPTRAG